MKKKFLLFLLLALLLPSTAVAYNFVVDDIYYNVSGNEATVTYKTTAYNSYTGTVTIPSTVTYNGTTYTVTAIGANAFLKSTGLTSVIIPNTVTSIGDYAFTQCSRLTSVTIPNSIITIGNYAFQTCTGLTNFSFPNSLVQIKSYAFAQCTGLTSLTIPNSVTSIGDYAFTSCNGLTNLVIGNSVRTIGNYAFQKCSGLTSLTIPNSVTSIGNYAFSGCSALANMEIGNSVKTIGNYAFYNCTSITTVTIPNSVNSIGTMAFYGCELTYLSIGDSVTEIGSYAFRECTGLTNVTIPTTVLSFGTGVFSDCTGLRTLVFNAINCQDFSSYSTNTMHVFYNCPLETIIIGDEVKNVPEYFTQGSTKTDLTKLIIGNSVTTIGKSAFQSCTGLTSLTLPNSISSIGTNAFGGCTNLKTLYISGNGAWSAGGLPMASNITTLYIGSDITVLSDMKVNPTEIYCYAAVPPTCHSNAFTGYTGTLHVPASSYATYCFALTWENFTDIVADAVEPQTVRLNKTSLDMHPTEQQTLTATVQPTGAYPNSSILWWSSDPNVATVVNGVVTAVAPGECDIYASCYPVKSKCHVVVSDMSSHIVIALDQHEAEVKVNHMINLIPTMTPEETDLVVTSSDPTVAGARIVNGTVRVVGIHIGTTTITVASADGSAQPDTCLVTVFTDPGDVNSDGVISISDVTNLINQLLTQDVIENPYADVNGDGVVNIKDVTTLINILLSSD